MFSVNDFEAKMCHLVHHSYFAVYHGLAAYRDYRFSRFSFWRKKITFSHLLEYPPQPCASSYLRFLSKLRVSLHFFHFGDARFEKEKTRIKVYDNI